MHHTIEITRAAASVAFFCNVSAVEVERQTRYRTRHASHYQNRRSTEAAGWYHHVGLAASAETDANGYRSFLARSAGERAQRGFGTYRCKLRDRCLLEGVL